MLTGAGVADLPAEVASEVPHSPQVPVAAPGRPWWRDPATWAIVLALVVWASPLTHGGGGRDAQRLTYGLLALIPALLLVRPWQRLGKRDLLAFAPAAAATLACFVAPTGFDGLDETVAFAYAGLLFVAIRGYLADPADAETRTFSPLDRRTRVTVVVTVVMLAGLDQFVTSWWAWYGSQDSSNLMVGTFFWHNQFAAFMAALGVFGGALAVRGDGRLRWLGGAVAVVTVPSLAFAASRSTLALFVLAWIVLALVSVRRPKRLLTLVVVPVLGVLFALFLASPLLMAGSNEISANISQRGEPVVGNGSARLAYDRAALHIVSGHPFTGTGFDSFAGASAPYLPEWLSQPTAYVHNGVLEAFVDGGVVLGGAVLLVALLPLGVGARRAWRSRLGRRRDEFDAVTLGAFAALGMLAAHTLIDDDWTYPSFVALYAIVAALLTRQLVPARAYLPPRPTRRTRLVVGAVIAAVLVVALPASVRVSAAENPRNSLPGWTSVVSYGLPVTHPPAWAEGATACGNRLRTAVDSGSTAGLEADLDCSAAVGTSEPSTQIFRARALMLLGRHAQAQAMADDLADRYGVRIPQILVLRAALPADGGDTATALRQVEALLTDPRVVARPQAVLYATSVRDQLRKG